MSVWKEVRPQSWRGKLLMLGLVSSTALVTAGLLPALAQDLTETGLGTSWFATIQDFEAKTGQKLTLSEAPDLAAQVAAGTLPPLDQRLPADVAVVVPYAEMGQYGGTWHEVTDGQRLDDVGQTVYTDAWLQWDREAKAIRPNLLTDYHFDDDGKTLVLAFRQGVKWSDGEPFTTDDLKYAWDRIITNKDFQATAGADGQNNSPVLFAHNTDGSFAELEIVDDHTIKFHYNSPNYGAQYFLPWWNQGYITFHQPKHYLMQFDPMYNTDIKDYSLMTQMDKALENPELPVLWAWRGVSLEPGVRLTMERNPYYWKVDTAGKQLPYIDKVQIDVVLDREVRLLKLVSGEYDASFRGAPDPENIALFKEKGAENGVGIKLWGAHGGYPIYQVNQTLAPSEDPYLRTLFQNRDFRCAMSESLDRDHINDVVLQGMGETGQATLPPSDPVFQGDEGQALFAEWRANCSTYDVEHAGKLLDAAGLDKRDAEGFRLRADGTPLTVVAENLPKTFQPAIRISTATGRSCSSNTSKPSAFGPNGSATPWRSRPLSTTVCIRG
jgi:peptide/nickel transport system substrate-binding protein